MANKDLKGRTWKIPKKYIILFQTKIKNYSGNKHVEGYTRLQNLIEKGKISYENLKNIKHILEKNINNKTIYNLNGGEYFHGWINDQLNVARSALESAKKVKKDSGINNAYKKEHTKSYDTINSKVKYENKKHIKLLITEEQYKNIYL